MIARTFVIIVWIGALVHVWGYALLCRKIDWATFAASGLVFVIGALGVATVFDETKGNR